MLLVEAYTWQNRDDDATLIIDTISTLSQEDAEDAKKKHLYIKNKRGS